MRLIDADKCPCSDCGINGLYNGCTKECIMFKKWLDSTAYDVDKETWKYIDGYEETYQISNSGEVRNKHKEILTQATNNKGYKTVCLSRSGNTHQLLVHRLVAKYFVPNPMLKSQVNHIDEDKTNNHYTNLEWVTPKENINYGDAIRKSAEARGVRVARLNDDMDVVGIYPTISEASRQTGVPQQNISRCLSGGTKKAGGWHWMREDAIDVVKRGGIDEG